MSIQQRLSDITSSLFKVGSILGALRSLAGARGPGDPRATVAFTVGLIALSAKMAKSDGVVTGDEISAFNNLMQVPPEEAANVRHLFDLARRDVAGYEAYARQLAELLAGERALLTDVLEALFVVAAADGVLHEQEEAFLKAVADIFAIPESEFRYVRALFVADAANPYAVLGLTPRASDAEVRARHRKLVIESHPDRLMGRGVPAELVAAATRKLANINAAFDVIAKDRGL